MRSVEELLDPDGTGWNFLMRASKAATNEHRFLDTSDGKSGPALIQTGVTTASPMGAVVYETGGHGEQKAVPILELFRLQMAHREQLSRDG